MPADFLDTNIFVYLFDRKADAKRLRAEQLVREALLNRSGCISSQVVQETLNVLVRKYGLSDEGASDLLDDVLQPLWQVTPDAGLCRRALALRSRYGFSFYDALIVAAALEAGCTRLWSEDLQHGQHIGVLQVENPFRA